jgi:protein disulfide-isomerase
MIGEYKGNRDYTDLSTFVDAQAAAYRKERGVSDIPHPADASTVEEVKVAAPSTPTEAIAGLVAPPSSDTHAPDSPKPVDPPNAAPPAPPPATVKEEAPQIVLGPNPNGIVLKFGKDEAVKDLPALQRMLSKEGETGSTFVKCE